MATKTFCDLCGDEVPVARTALMNSAVMGHTVFTDLGDTCDPCRTGAIVVLQAWRDEKLKTKKVTQVVVAQAVKS